MVEKSSRETAANVLAELHQRAQFGLAEGGIRDIAASLGIGRSTASRALRLLRAEGAISAHRPGTGDGYRSVWRIERWTL
jgi:CRP-like cAMP-binding protein